MTVYKRDRFGHIIPKNKINSTKGTWYVDKMIRGRRYRFAVPEATTRRQAERAEAKLKTEIFEARYGSKGKSSFVKFVDEVYLPWSKENKRSWKHDELYAKIIKDFFRGYNFEDISPLLIEKFKRTRRAGMTNRGEQRATSTVNREMAQLSKMFSLALKLGFCSENPCRRVDAFKVNNRKERVVTYEEEGRILEALTGKLARLKTPVIVALNCGLRLGEIFNMEWRHVDFQKGVIEIPRGSTKSGKGRIAVMNRRVKDAMAELRGDSDQTGYVFPFDKQKACAAFSHLCKDIELGGVTFHTLRHTFSTRLAEANVNPFTARDLMGHEEVNMTGYYTHTAIETMREAVTRLERASNRSDFAANVSQTSGEKNVEHAK
jgi:integrase